MKTQPKAQMNWAQEPKIRFAKITSKGITHSLTLDQSILKPQKGAIKFPKTKPPKSYSFAVVAGQVINLKPRKKKASTQSKRIQIPKKLGLRKRTWWVLESSQAISGLSIWKKRKDAVERRSICKRSGGKCGPIVKVEVPCA